MINPTQTQPRSQQAEEVVAASYIEANGEPLPPYFLRVVECSPDSFADKRLGDAVATARRMKANGEQPNALAIAEKLKFPDAAVFLTNLVNTNALLPATAEHNARSVWESYQRRHSRDLLTVAAQEIDRRPDAAPNIIAHTIEALRLLDNESPNRRKLSMRQPDELLAMQFDDGDRILGDRLAAKGQSAVILGAGGIGKTRLLLQFAASQSTGRPFIGFETGSQGLRWLILQTENSNRRLKQDLLSLKKWLGDDWQAFSRSVVLHTLETDADGIMSLADFGNCAAIESLIADVKPDVIAWDPLADFAIGDPNQDGDMRDTLRTISQLCRKGKPDRAIIILHHALTGRTGASRATGFDRASFGRNSKVLHAWTRGQINVAAVDGDSNDRLVIACGKCSNGKEFEPFGVRLNPATMIYEPDPDFDLEGWQAAVAGKADSPRMTPQRVRELCDVGGMTKPALSKAIQEECGCVRGSSYRYIDRAETAKTIKRSKTNEYFRA